MNSYTLIMCLLSWIIIGGIGGFVFAKYLYVEVDEPATTFNEDDDLMVPVFFGIIAGPIIWIVMADYFIKRLIYKLRKT